VLSGDPVTEITALKGKVARDILVAGSSQLVHLLAANDLVDQYNLMIFPGAARLGQEAVPRREARGAGPVHGHDRQAGPRRAVGRA
jgi:dihydrofolate reductase